MRGSFSSLAAFAALGLALAAPDTVRAQNPEKFERVAPQAPARPAVPQTADPQMRELIRKATAREKENGFCARVSWRRYYGTYCELVPLLEGRAAGLVSTSGMAGCVVTQISAELLEAGKRYRHFQQWFCPLQGNCHKAKEKVDLSKCGSS